MCMLYVPLITPFGTDGAVAWPALEALAHDLLADGATGLVALGTTAEPASLTPGEIDPEVVAFLATPPADCTILAGDDVLLSPLLALGAHGGILASAHIGTASYAALITAWRAGDLAVARPLGHRLATLSAALFA